MNKEGKGSVVKKPEPKMAVPASLVIPFDIKTEVGGMTMHLLTEDRLDSLEAGCGSHESNAFSAALAIFLTVGGLLVGARIAAGSVLGSLSLPLWALLFASGGLALYFWKVYREKHRRVCERFKNIREKSTTVVGISARDSDNGKAGLYPSQTIPH